MGTQEAIGSHLSVRLDSRTNNELAVLVEHYTEILGEKVTPSQAVRIAIHELYKQRAT